MSEEQKKVVEAPSTEPASKPAAEQADPKATHLVKDLKHDSPLMRCRFDPTGRFVFATAQDSRVLRWDLADGKKVELAAHESWVWGLALDPAGQTLITGGYDGRLIWWPAADEKPAPLRTVDAHQGWVRAVDVSPDGQLVASAGNDQLVKLWSVADGSLVRQLKGHQSHVYNVLFHPDGKHLVSGDLKAKLKYWEVASGKQVRDLSVPALHNYDGKFRADIGGTRGMAFSGDGKRLAVSGITQVTNAFAGDGNPAAVVLDWESGKQQVEHLAKDKPKGTLWGVSLHKDGFTIGGSGGHAGGFLYFWQPGQKHPFHQLKLPNTVHDMVLHPDGLQVATTHFDGHLRISKMRPKA